MLVGAVNQEKVIVGAFSVIVQIHRLILFISTPQCPVSSSPARLMQTPTPSLDFGGHCLFIDTILKVDCMYFTTS